jgi:ankyrin repeat protein
MDKYFRKAIGDGDTNVVRQLLKTQPDLIQRAESNGDTPLLLAASATNSNRSVGCVRALIEAGADVNAKDSYGYTVVHYAVGLWGTGWGNRAKKIIRLLVKSGATLESQHHYGWTPLMQALLEGTPDQVRFLLNVGANPNVKFPSYALPEFTRGRSLLGIAMVLDEVYAVEQFIKAGADISARDDYYQTALEYAQQAFEERMLRDREKDSMQCAGDNTI